MSKSINIVEFLELSEIHPILDIRTPLEFGQGHIPGARNLPLFSNEERKIVGTIYKQEGRQAAVLKGLELVGPRLPDIIKLAGKISKDNVFLLHCWRGGMRSSSLAWLFETYGFKTYTLKGGYKSFRNFVLEKFSLPQKLLVLGGRTGAGKTLVLYKLAEQGEQIIDLEKLAHHKGSSFGALGEEKQPSQEGFENKLAMELHQLDNEKTIWLEDESRMVGNKVIPAALWEQMRHAKVVYMDVSLNERVNYLVEEYGKFTKEELIESTRRIGKRLGGQYVKLAIAAIEQGDLKTACEINLVYYDKAYDFGIKKRAAASIINCNFSDLKAGQIAKEIVRYAK